MIASFLTHPLVIAALISFLIGSFGTVVFLMVIRPVAAYYRLKRQIRKALTRMSQPEASGGAPALTGLAAELTAVYQKTLPQWYRLVLSNRDERPMDAARDLARLAKTRAPEQIRARIEDIRGALHLT